MAFNRRTKLDSVRNFFHSSVIPNNRPTKMMAALGITDIVFEKTDDEFYVMAVVQKT